MPRTARIEAADRRLRVGDLIEQNYGSRPVRGKVIEDRGNLGVGGRQIVRISMRLDSVDEPLEYESPAETLRLVTETSSCD